MKIKINNYDWKIIELSSEKFYLTREALSKDDRAEFPKSGCILGFTDQMQHIIYLNSEIQCKCQLRLTLIHELTHAWLWIHGASYTSYEEEALCDTVATIHDFISGILKKYFGE